MICKYETTQKGVETCPEYLSAKFEYENNLNEKTKGPILCSKTLIHEQNEKSSKYFLNLEKRNASNNTIKVLADENLTTDSNEITKQIKSFYSNLFKSQSEKSTHECEQFLTSLQLPQVSEDLNFVLRKPLTIFELEDAIKN